MKTKISTILLFLCLTHSFSQINPQEKTMWCWASCIQSVMAQGDYYQTQSQIVATLAGWPQDRPANIPEVITILRYYNFTAWSVDYPANPDSLWDTLTSGWKLIAFVNPTNNPQVGHFILIQGISKNRLVVISDPTTGQTYEQTLDDLYYGWQWSRSVMVGKHL